MKLKLTSLIICFAMATAAMAQGKVGVNTTSPGSMLSINGNTAIGTNYAGQVAPANGLAVEGRLGIGTTNPLMALHVASNDGLLATGAYNNGSLLSISGSGVRMIWYPRKAAFRAGGIDAAQWDDANTGEFSAAMGYNNTASNHASIALGQFNIASGNSSISLGHNNNVSGISAGALGKDNVVSGDVAVAIGNQNIVSSFADVALGKFNTASGGAALATGQFTTASGYLSTAMGDHSTATATSAVATGSYTTASGDASTAMGNNTDATANSATAMGNSTLASNQSATAMGQYTIASGASSTAMGDNTDATGIGAVAMGYFSMATQDVATAMGHYTTASGYISTAMGNHSLASGGRSLASGFYSTASGDMSTALGYYTIAPSFAETVIGYNNTSYTPANISGATGSDRLFVIGNGANPGNRADALVMLKNGSTGLGTSAPGATLAIHSGQSNMLTLSRYSGNAGDKMMIGFSHNNVSDPSNDRARMGVEIQGTGSGDIVFENLTGGTMTEKVRITGDGDVKINRGAMIGNIIPSHTNNGTTTTRFGSSAAGGFTGMQINSSWDGNFNDEDISFYIHDGGTSGGEGVRINKSGNMGIGTTTPTERLDVVGNIKSSSLSGSGTRMVVADANGVMSTQAIPSGGGGASPDNLGNHTATQNLSLASFQLVGNGGANGIAITSGGTVGIANLAGSGTRMVVTDASGALSAQTIPSGGSSDNLGNHTATQSLNLANQVLVGNGGTTGISISNAGVVGIGNLAGAGTRMMVVDASGAVSTQAIPSGGGGGSADNLGNHTATQNLNLANNVLVGNGGSTGITIASSGNVGVATLAGSGTRMVVADASGVMSTQAIPSGGGGGGADNLGNHTATQNLNLAGNQLVGNGGSTGIAITNAGTIGLGTTSPSEKLEVVGNMKSSSLAGAGTRMVVADANGIMSTQAIPSGGGGGSADNLGNHTATQNLDLGTFRLVGNGGASGIVIGNNGNTAIGIASASPTDRFYVSTSTMNASIRAVNLAATLDYYGSIGSCNNTSFYGTGVGGFGGKVGVYGQANLAGAGTYHAGVYGYATGSSLPVGVTGDASSTSGPSRGVNGTASGSSPRGVHGEAVPTSGTAAYGVFGGANGTSANMYGVYGTAACTGTGNAAAGVYGLASGAGTTVGVYASGVTAGGYFQGSGSVYAYVADYGNNRKITGSGTVSEIIPTANHGRITLTCPESPEYWYQDYGTVTLVNGKAHVDLDPILADIIVVDANNPLKVFCQDDMLTSNGLAIVNKTATGFDIIEKNGGTNSGTIDYQIIAKPKTNYGEGRFIQAPAPAYLKGKAEPVASRAANRTVIESPEKVYRWSPDWEVYNYDPADYEQSGLEEGKYIMAGPHAGMYKMADGTFSKTPKERVVFERPTEPTNDK